METEDQKFYRTQNESAEQRKQGQMFLRKLVLWGLFAVFVLPVIIAVLWSLLS